MELTILEILYIVLIIFTSIIWTLLTLALLKLLKVLDVAVEVTWYYNKIKEILAIYSKIPELLKEKIKELFTKREEDEE